MITIDAGERTYELVPACYLAPSASKPFPQCAPEQNGLFVEPPQRQSAHRSRTSYERPSGDTIGTPPVTA